MDRKKSSDITLKVGRLDIVAKRIIAWTSNSRLTYEDGNIDYKEQV